MRSPSSRPRLRAGLAAGALGLAAAATSLAVPATAASAAPTSVSTTSSPVAGKIKHVWLIILENKSYDASETGLNSNSYLWQTLPSQGVLLKNYYGTGHSSQDNYEALVSGQAPEEDTQGDCGTQDYNFGSSSLITDPTNSNGVAAAGNAGTINSGTTSQNLGQVVSAAGSNSTGGGTNGCSYPETAPTLFNQFDAAGVTWKGYNQDLHGASANSPTAAPQGPGATTATVDLKPGDGSQNQIGGVSDVQNRDSSVCGGPGSSTNFPGAKVSSASLTGSTVTSSPATYSTKSFGSAEQDDQYVAKHSPFPWFQSLTGTTGTPLAGTNATQGTGITTPANGGTDCDANHVVNLDDPNTGLVHDLASEATTPAFSWITPDNCSDAHDATCAGNNLSGAFGTNADGTANLSAPKYFTNGNDHYDPEQYAPTNYVGGLYASDLFLAYYIPIIESSPAFKDGGLIDVTWDEANPPYVNSSFNNQPTPSLLGSSSPTLGTAGSPSDLYGSSQTPPAACLSPTANGGTNTVLEPCTPYFGTSGKTGTANGATNPDGSAVYAPGANSYLGGLGLLSDSAGQNINGQNLNSEPQGPNSVEYYASGSSTVSGTGPGNGSFIDRGTAANGSSAKTTGSARTVTLTSGSALVTDNGITPGVTGSPVQDSSCGQTAGNGTACTDGFPNPAGGVFVGQVTNTGPVFSQVPSSNAYQSGEQTYDGHWTLVDQNGNPLSFSGTTGTKPLLFSTAVLPGTQQAGTLQYADPVNDTTDLTPGGGDTGSILISPYITPGTSTTTYYNHYSWLKTMEDIFSVGSGAASTTNNPVFLTDSANNKDTVAGGLDGTGHLGYAAQSGLAEFGTDVFNNPAGTTAITPTASLPEAPLAIGIPLLGLLAGGMYVGMRRRQRRVTV